MIEFRLSSSIGIAAGLVLTTTLYTQQLYAQQVFKCTDLNGATRYTDKPCVKDDIDEETVDVTPHQGHAPTSQRLPASRRWQSSDSLGLEHSDAESFTKISRQSKNQRLRESEMRQQRALVLSELRRGMITRQAYLDLIDELIRLDDVLGITEEDLDVYDRKQYKEIASFLERDQRQRSRASAPAKRTNAPFAPSRPNTASATGIDGTFYQGVGGGMIDTRTGDFLPGTNGRFIDTKTGKPVVCTGGICRK